MEVDGDVTCAAVTGLGCTSSGEDEQASGRMLDRQIAYISKEWALALVSATRGRRDEELARLAAAPHATGFKWTSTQCNLELVR